MAVRSRLSCCFRAAVVLLASVVVAVRVLRVFRSMFLFLRLLCSRLCRFSVVVVVQLRGFGQQDPNATLSTTRTLALNERPAYFWTGADGLAKYLR